MEAKRTLEKSVPPFINYCLLHGEHKTEVCGKCYNIQAIRVEKESAILRTQNNSESLRKWVLSHQNGKAK